MNKVQEKNLEDYRQQLESRGTMLPEEIDELIKEKVREIDLLNNLGE